MQNLDNHTLQLAIVAAVAIAMLIHAIVLLAILVVVRKSARSMSQQIEEMRSSVTSAIQKAEPVLEGANNLLARTGPQIEATVHDLATLSANLRKQSDDVQSAATEIVERFRRQSARVDAKLTSIFDVLDRTTEVMSEAVSKPMRQLAGILASAKAVVETFRNGTAQTQPDDAQGDKDMYV